jgi:HipA-like protein
MNYAVSTPAQLRIVLRALRDSRGLSQAQLGDRIGVSQRRIATIEAAPGRASFDQLSRIVAALGGRLAIEDVSANASAGHRKKSTKATRSERATGNVAATSSLTVWMNGLRLGTWSIVRHVHVLKYDPAWIESPAGRPLSLSLPFTRRNEPIRGAKVEPYFDNLLPDVASIRNRIRTKFATASRITSTRAKPNLPWRYAAKLRTGK